MRVLHFKRKSSIVPRQFLGLLKSEPLHPENLISRSPSSGLWNLVSILAPLLPSRHQNYPFLKITTHLLKLCSFLICKYMPKNHPQSHFWPAFQENTL
jgi:hypothetical protein